MVDVAGQNRRLPSEGAAPPPAPFSAPRTSLNGNLSSRRRYATVAVPLADAKLVRRAFGTTVNDVLLGSWPERSRRLLALRGDTPVGSLVAMVPVSTRRTPDRGTSGTVALGNRVSGMLVSLATTVEDPVERLLAISREHAGGQSAGSAGRWPAAGGHGPDSSAGAGIPGDAVGVGAPPLRSGVAAVQRHGLRVCRGRASALWFAGSRVVELHPVGPVAEGVGLNVTSMTYEDSVRFGLLGCRRLVPDVHDLAVLLDDALRELVAAALDARGAAG